MNARYYVLEDRVPLPPKLQPRYHGAVYPLETMQPGQSFLVPHEKGKSVAVICVQFAQKHPGWRFATRLTNEGVRVWRLHPLPADSDPEPSNEEE